MKPAGPGAVQDAGRPSGSRSGASTGKEETAMDGVDARTLVRRMDLFTLRLFMIVVEEGQLARAASREHIVPSAVTKRIRELEELLGVRLFFRTPTGTTLTAAGEVVARHVERIFHRIELM